MKNHQVTANIGLFYVCQKLSQLGLNAIPTSRNAKGADVIVYHPDNNKVLTIQVKTMSEKSPGVRIAAKVGDDKIEETKDKRREDLWVIIVVDKAKEVCDEFIFDCKNEKTNNNLIDADTSKKNPWWWYDPCWRTRKKNKFKNHEEGRVKRHEEWDKHQGQKGWDALRQKMN